MLYILFIYLCLMIYLSRFIRGYSFLGVVSVSFIQLVCFLLLILPSALTNAGRYRFILLSCVSVGCITYSIELYSVCSVRGIVFSCV